jgi:uncharacterized protein
MVRHVRSVLCAVVVVGFLSGCEGGQTLDSSQESQVASGALSGADAMIVYSPRGKPVDEAGFFWLGPVELLGGRVLEGEPRIYARIDYQRHGTTAGLFKATRGRVEVTFPFTEHATILEGEVTVTDETGQRHTYKAGDSYFIRQGQVVLWEVKGKQVIKSFLNIVESP